MSDELRVSAEPIGSDSQPAQPESPSQDILAETLRELEATKLRLEFIQARVEEAIGPVELTQGDGAAPVEVFPAPQAEIPQVPVAEFPAPQVEMPAAPVAEFPAPQVEMPQVPVAEAPQAPVVEFPYPQAPVAEIPAAQAEAPQAPVAEFPAPQVEMPQIPVTEAQQAPVAEFPTPQFEVPATQIPQVPPAQIEVPQQPVVETFESAPVAMPVDPFVQTPLQPGDDPYAHLIGVPTQEEPQQTSLVPEPQPVIEMQPQQPSDAPVPEAIDLLAAMALAGGSDRADQAQAEQTLQLIREQAKAGRDEKRTHKNTRRQSNEQVQLFPVMTRFQPGHPLVITFTSPKGGVAKSTTAVSMAGYLAKSGELSGNPIRVLLVDGDVANGNLALRVAKTVRPNLLDMLKNVDATKSSGQVWGTDFARDIAPFVLVDERIPNLALVAAPENASVINEVSQQDLEEMVGAFARFYDVIIFDSGTQIIEHTNCAWLAFASQVYLMMEPETSCLHQTREYAARAVGMGLLTEDRFRAVMIRADMDLDGLDPEAVMAEMFPYIPGDRRFLIPDFHRDGIATANAGEILSLESQAYATAITPMVQSALSSYEREQGLRA